MPASPNQPVPLYGGMQLTPPRTEDKKTSVFAVIANPEVLKQRGKNAKDQEVSLYIILYNAYLCLYKDNFSLIVKCNKYPSTLLSN